MTLVQLEYLIAVDTYRSFVLAAEKCFVTQPTLSMQIQKLEDALGVRLFDRSRQPVVPTEMGKLIIAQARVVIRESKKIMEMVQEQKGELAGELKLGIIPTIAPYLLPKVLGTFMQKYPQVQLQIWEYTTERIIRELKVGLLDCGILSTPVQDASLYEKPLFYEPFVAYVSANGPLYQKKMIGTDDILLDKIWLLNEGHCMRGQALNICQRKQPVGDLLFEYNTGSVETLKRMVDVNAGSTILPELSISDFNEDQMERIRFFKTPEPVREISMVTMPNHLKSRAIEALEKEIQAGVPPRYLSSKKKEIIDYH